MKHNIAADIWGSDTYTVQRKRILMDRIGLRKQDLIDLLQLIVTELEMMEGDPVIHDLTIDRENGHAAVYYDAPEQKKNNK